MSIDIDYWACFSGFDGANPNNNPLCGKKVKANCTLSYSYIFYIHLMCSVKTKESLSRLPSLTPVWDVPTSVSPLHISNLFRVLDSHVS